MFYLKPYNYMKLWMYKEGRQISNAKLFLTKVGAHTAAGSKFMFTLSSPSNRTCTLARANHKAYWLRHPPSKRGREIPPMGKPYYVMTSYRSRVGGKKKKVKVKVSLLGIACVLRFRGEGGPNPPSSGAFRWAVLHWSKERSDSHQKEGKTTEAWLTWSNPACGLEVKR